MKNLNFLLLFLIFSCNVTPDFSSTKIGFENEGEVNEVVDANIVDGKIKTIYLYTGQQKMNPKESSG